MKSVHFHMEDSICNPPRQVRCTVCYSVPRKTWHSGEIFHLVLRSSLPCYLWVYQGEHVVGLRVLSATCCRPSCDVHPQVLCLLLSQEPIDYRHKTRPSCLFNLRQHHGKIDGNNHISRFTSSATNTRLLFLPLWLWQFWMQPLDLLECLRPNLMFRGGISIFAASTSGCFML